MDTALLQHLCKTIGFATQQDSIPLTAIPASGGCIHSSFVLQGATQRYFVKTNRAELLDLFIAEARSLEVLTATNTIRVPRPLHHGVAHSTSYLILEHLPLVPSRDPLQAAAMGTQLAALHRHLAGDHHHGWHATNYIGTTPQPNQPHPDWITFWREQRLEWQFKLAHDRGIRFKNCDQLLESLPVFFDGYHPVPSLLHGDLWSGNASYTPEGVPVVYDPASYYGDRETDLAFTELFGGFPTMFYTAYDEAWPRHPGWRIRRELYNLYHILNHHHLFGGHYARQAQQIIDHLLKQC
jgi:protein-ribulosamine 3-kinase